MFRVTHTQFEPAYDSVHLPAQKPQATLIESDENRPILGGGIGPGAMVETLRGPVAATDICRGDMVQTRDNAYRPVLWIGRERQQYTDATGPGPIRFRHGAMDQTAALKSLILAPEQRVLLVHVMNEIFFGTPDVLCSTRDLTHLSGVSEVENRHAVEWVHLLFDQTEVIQIEGLWVESLSPDMPRIRDANPNMATGIENAIPSLRYEHGMAAFIQPLPILNKAEVQLLHYNEA